MSQAQLEKKVTDYLRKSQALKDYWQRPITAEQLQAEMDRMAKHTRQPDVLRELFEALGNDPFIIAECLARPALADRLLTSWYAYDERIHGELKQCAEAELRAHPPLEQMKLTNGKYNEVVFAKSDASDEKPNRGAAHAILLNSREWDSTAQILSATFNKSGVTTASEFGLQRHVVAFQSADTSVHSKSVAPETYESIPIGILGPLQEDQERYYAIMVIEKTADDFKLASVSWLKKPLESWLARAESQVASAMQLPTASYTLPTVSEGSGCLDDTWTTTSGPPDPRGGPTAVWTGSEMIVWGGGNNSGNLDTGGRYNPATDSWTPTATINAPSARAYHTAVWTGSEMVVWGGLQTAPTLEPVGDIILEPTVGQPPILQTRPLAEVFTRPSGLAVR